MNQQFNKYKLLKSVWYILCVWMWYVYALHFLLRFLTLLSLYVCFRPSVYFLCPFYFKNSLTLIPAIFPRLSLEMDWKLNRYFRFIVHMWYTHIQKWHVGEFFIEIKTWNDAHLRHCIIHPIKMQLELIFPRILFYSLRSHFNDIITNQMEFQTDCFVYQKKCSHYLWFHS